jgi:hypothetical protein
VRVGIRQNLTSNEIINAWRYNYLHTSPGSVMQNPFDLGEKENIRDFFFHSSGIDYLYVVVVGVGVVVAAHLIFLISHFSQLSRTL